MSTYDITLTDPLMSGFTIQPGAFDGPGGSRANTTLRLYGRGALEWGEAVDEDLVRLAETFAGSTPPLNPIPGQLWMRVRYYWHDTSATPTTGWWFYDPRVGQRAWQRLNGTGTISDSPSSNPTIGSYYVDTTTNALYRWDSAYKQAGAAWLNRNYSASNLSGSAPSQQPEQDLLVWDQFANSGAGRWATPLTVAAVGSAPQEAQQGTLWYDLTTGKLKIWTGTEWKEILGPTNGGATTATGNINMQNYSITNLADGNIVAGNKEAVNGGTVYAYVTDAISDLSGVYLPLTGGTVTGNLTVNGTSSHGGTANFSGNVNISGTAAIGTANITALTVSSSASMNNQRIQSLGNGTAASDAVNKGQLDTAITNLSNSLGGITSANVSMVWSGSGTYKKGDIYVDTSQAIPRIYIAVASGTAAPPSTNWRLVFPAAFL